MKANATAPTFRAGSRESWRAWLQGNHETEKVVWVVFPKKHTGEDCMSYDDSVEEALCFGWIDSIIKRVDDDRHDQHRGHGDGRREVLHARHSEEGAATCRLSGCETSLARSTASMAFGMTQGSDGGR